ncbi:MAG: hypothetical protein ACKV0T_06400, partial [Planctomycetales bacterium]
MPDFVTAISDESAVVSHCACDPAGVVLGFEPLAFANSHVYSPYGNTNFALPGLPGGWQSQKSTRAPPKAAYG